MQNRQNEWMKNAVKLEPADDTELQNALEELQAARTLLTYDESRDIGLDGRESCALREDTIIESLSNDEVLQNSSFVQEGQFVLPRAIHED